MNFLLAALVRCIVGCNAGASDAQTLHVLECDTATGEMSTVQTVKGVQGTNYFCIDREKKNLLGCRSPKTFLWYRWSRD